MLCILLANKTCKRHHHHLVVVVVVNKTKQNIHQLTSHDHSDMVCGVGEESSVLLFYKTLTTLHDSLS